MKLHRLLVVASCAPLLLAAESRAAQAPARQPLTHEALWLMKRVGRPPSRPTGGSSSSRSPSRPTTRRRRSPISGSCPPTAARRRAGSRPPRAARAEPRWSPDSRRLAFTAKREDDEVSQIYVLDVAGGGEARRVSGSPLAARAPRVEPRRRAGSLYQAAVYPGAADVEANRRSSPSARTRSRRCASTTPSPSAAGTGGSTTPGRTCSWCRADGEGRARDLLAGTTLGREPGFGGRRRRRLDARTSQPAWAPDGTLARVRGHHQPRRRRLRLGQHAPLRGAGRGRRAARAHERQREPRPPRFAPDGRSLCFRVERGLGQDLRPRPPGLRAPGRGRRTRRAAHRGTSTARSATSRSRPTAARCTSPPKTGAS